MSTQDHDQDPRLDAAARALHHAASSSVSATTLARLRAARHSLPRREPVSRGAGSWKWLGAGLASIALLVAIGVLPDQHALPDPATAPALTANVAQPADPAYPTSLAALDEDPDLYVWLAADAVPLTPEQL